MFKTKCLTVSILIIFINCVGSFKTVEFSASTGPYKVVFHNVPNEEDCFIELFQDGKKILYKVIENYSYVNIIEKSKKIVLLSNINKPNKTQILVITFNGGEVLKKTLNPEILQNYSKYGINIDSNTVLWYNDKNPNVNISESSDTFKVLINTPNNKIITYYNTRDTTKRRGIAGIGYGRNQQRQNPDSMLNEIFHVEDSVTYLGAFKSGTLTGLRSKKNIMKSIMTILAPIRYDYNKLLRERPGIKGKIVLKFKIIASGDVVSCKTVEKTLFDDIFEKKVEDHIKNCKFEQFDSTQDTTEVVYPFVFMQ